jgi:hypothetical protein
MMLSTGVRCRKWSRVPGGFLQTWLPEARLLPLPGVVLETANHLSVCLSSGSPAACRQQLGPLPMRLTTLGTRLTLAPDKYRAACLTMHVPGRHRERKESSLVGVHRSRSTCLIVQGLSSNYVFFKDAAAKGGPDWALDTKTGTSR